MGERSPSARPEPGRLLGDRYRVVRLLGRGAMAEVWEAIDEVLDRPVAVKVLFAHLTDDPTFVTRFRREALAVARIGHPGIVAVYDTVRADRIEAMVLELVDGPTLRDVLADDGVLDEAEVVRLGIALADALHAAHHVGVVHRDVKPSNILIGADGAPRLADFGVAADGEDGLTAVGTLVGTAAYVSPEQVHGAPADARSDVYGLACVLFEAACGRPPFRAGNDAATALARLQADAPDARSLRPALSGGLAAVLAGALARDPAVRTVDAATLRDQLRGLGRGSGAVGAPGSTPVGRPRPAPAAADPPTVVLPTLPTTAEVPATAVTGPVPDPDPARGTDARRAGRHRAPRRGPRRTRRRAWWVVASLLTIGSLLLVVALVQPADEPARITTTTAPPGPVAVVEVRTVDPFGRGTPGENDALRDRLVDGDPTSTWRTEAYDDQEFGTKPGVGVALRLAAPTEVVALEVASASLGWIGEVAVVDDLATIPPAPPVVRTTFAAGRRRVELGGHRGRWVVVWITRLGDSPGRHTVELGELEVIGAGRG